MTHNDEPRGNIAPKRGLPWLADKLKEGRDDKQAGAWQPATTTRHDFRAFTAKLATPDERTPLQRRADERHDAKEHLSNDLLLDLMSVRVLARDKLHRGRVVECWLRGVLLRRIIEKPSPNRNGMNTAKYSIAIALMCNEGVAEPLPSGANGYRWTHEYERIGARANWLVDYVRRAGELRGVSAAKRYETFG